MNPHKFKPGPSPYRLLTEALAAFKDDGYTENFQYKDGKLVGMDSGNSYRQEELTIHEWHRFEGESNPADMSITFAVAADDGTKGAVVSAYGAHTDTELMEFMEAVEIADREEMGGPIGE